MVLWLHTIGRTAATFRRTDRLTQLDEAQRQLREAVARFAAAEVAPHAEAADRTNVFPRLRELYSKMGAMGLHGVAVPSDKGGLGLGLLEHCLCVEELSRASAALGLSYGAHSELCIGQLVRHGTPAQRARLLPRLLAGTAIGALAMTEPDAGTDVFAMRTCADRAPPGRAGYVLNGTKTFITNAGLADVYIVYAKTRPDLGAKGISCFVVEAPCKGLSCSPHFDKLGMRGCPTAQLTFENCIVPAENLLGKENDGAAILRSGLDTERLVLAAGPLGIMAACLDTVLPYVKQRKQFGKVCFFSLFNSHVAKMHS